MANPVTATTASSAVKSADRAMTVVELVADAPDGVTFTQIQQALALPKSSLHALLSTLVGRDWLELSARGVYSIGHRLRTLSTSGDHNDSVIDAAVDLLEQARDQLGETVHLATLTGTDILYLASRYSRQALGVRFHSGRRLPLHATGLGKAILSTLDPAEVPAHLPETLAPLTPNTITDPQHLTDELIRVREQGYAVDLEEGTPGLCCVAVPFLAHGRHYAISCSKPSARWSSGEEVTTASLLNEVTRTILRRLR
ncbi:IclR family transcriptional regulator [Nakamurella deserti]|uniref:IclR family transcriptional regulator n=1 Tax=Nakamurella deserti TaxID=2164074 RepID=UPI000DBE3399|nr:IclR family transcriptional regulator [Nakamurella deserti]